MKVETRETDRGTEITVETEEKVAVIVDTGDGERIYLPSMEASDSSYYVEDPEGLRQTEKGYVIIHPGEVENVDVVS